MLRILITIILVNMIYVVSASLAFAASPQINTVIGTIQSGSILTISGQYLMDENRTNWLSQFRSGTSYGFEGNSYTADGFYEAPDQMVHGTRGYDTNVKLSGNKSIFGRVTAATKTGAGFNISVNGAELYERFYTRWHSAGTWKWPSNYIKLSMAGGMSDMLYVQPAATNGTTLPTRMNIQYNSTEHLYSVSNFLQDNRWYCVETRRKTSAPTNFTTWVDGVQVASVSPYATGTLTFMFFGMINMCCQGPDFDLTNWIDNYTVSTSRVYPSAVVEIGNGYNYATATKVYQSPVYLSDTNVQVTLNLTGLGSGPYYLWVTNNRQERSAAYSLSGGAAPPDTAPNPPTGLRIINE